MKSPLKLFLSLHLELWHELILLPFLDQRSTPFNLKGKLVNCTWFKFTIDKMQWCGVKCIYPVGHTAVVHCAPFSYSGSGGMIQRSSCVSESHSSSCAPFTSAALLLRPRVCGRGEPCLLCCFTEAHFPSLVCYLGQGFLNKGWHDPACLSSADCQVPRVLLSLNSQMGSGPGPHSSFIDIQTEGNSLLLSSCWHPWSQQAGKERWVVLLTPGRVSKTHYRSVEHISKAVGWRWAVLSNL